MQVGTVVVAQLWFQGVTVHPCRAWLACCLHASKLARSWAHCAGVSPLPWTCGGTFGGGIFTP